MKCRALQAGGDKSLAFLNTLKGAAFDQANVDHECASHQQVSDALDTTLIRRVGLADDARHS